MRAGRGGAFVLVPALVAAGGIQEWERTDGDRMAFGRRGELVEGPPRSGVYEGTVTLPGHVKRIALWSGGMLVTDGSKLVPTVVSLRPTPPAFPRAGSESSG